MKPHKRQLRIIGGSLGGRRLCFTEVPGLRPTPDRVRETLFNWLAPLGPGLHVLDLFAGSGALGFEALSRGAAMATLVEADAAAGRRLRETAQALGVAGQVRVVREDALAFLQRERGPWDVVFLDPPFAGRLVAPALSLLARDGRLAAGGMCYVEAARTDGAPALPAGWQVHRGGKAGEVGYYLLHEPRSHLPGDL